MKIFKKIKGSELATKLLVAGFTVAAGAGTTTLLVDRIAEANEEQTINLNDNQNGNGTYSQEDIALYEEYGIWPGEYTFERTYFAGIEITEIHKVKVNSDGTITNQVYNKDGTLLNDYSGTLIVNEGAEPTAYYGWGPGGGIEIYVPDCAYEYGGCN